MPDEKDLGIQLGDGTYFPYFTQQSIHSLEDLPDALKDEALLNALPSLLASMRELVNRMRAVELTPKEFCVLKPLCLFRAGNVFGRVLLDEWVREQVAEYYRVYEEIAKSHLKAGRWDQLCGLVDRNEASEIFHWKSYSSIDICVRAC